MKVGYRTGLAEDRSRRNWQGDARRPLAWSAWYPVQTTPWHPPLDSSSILVTSGPMPVWLKDESFPLSSCLMGQAVLRKERAGWPGGSPRLVISSSAHITMAIRRENPTDLRFICWWERATDLSALLTILSNRGRLPIAWIWTRCPRSDFPWRLYGTQPGRCYHLNGEIPRVGIASSDPGRPTRDAECRKPYSNAHADIRAFQIVLDATVRQLS